MATISTQDLESVFDVTRKEEIQFLTKRSSENKKNTPRIGIRNDLGERQRCLDSFIRIRALRSRTIIHLDPIPKISNAINR